MSDSKSRKYCLLLIALILVVINASGQAPGDTTSLRARIKHLGQASVVIDYPGRDSANVIGRIVSIDRYRDGKLYLVINDLTYNDFIKAGVPFAMTGLEERKPPESAKGIAEAYEWQSYPTYSQYDSIMRSFALDYPEICILDTIGTSINGRLILVLKISDNAGIEEENEPKVFYSSTIHGDELAGFVLMMRLASFLLESYGVDEHTTALVNNLQIYINPLSNPDGTYGLGNTITNPVRHNANGIDLNRNFPDPGLPGMVIQKENADMIAFMRKHRFHLSANFHSGAEVVNYPWDRWSRIHADDSWFYSLGRSYADTVHKYAGLYYFRDFDNGVVRGSEWYMINGGRQDFVTWELQGREVTIELHNIKQTPADLLEDLWRYNKRSLLYYLSAALTGVQGAVTDAGSGKSIVACIRIPGHDVDNSHVYATGGYYTRLIKSGIWDLHFSSAGYRDTLIRGIEVCKGVATLLNVAMEPGNSSPDTLVTDRMLVVPNPSDGRFSIYLPGSFEGEVSIGIVSSAGVLVHNGKYWFSQGLPILIDGRQFAPGLYFVRARPAVGGVRLNSRVLIIR